MTDLGINRRSSVGGIGSAGGETLICPAASGKPVEQGTYTLLLSLDEPARFRVGALGERAFPAGAYAYTGSAFGPGGFERVERHRRLAAGDVDTRHWHIDYLLPLAAILESYTAPEEAIECEVARRLPGDRIEGFGASDCGCSSHLAFATREARIRHQLDRLYDDPTGLGE